MKRVKEWIVRDLPAAGIVKRFLVAAHDAVRPRSSYAQHGEDLRIVEMLDGFDSSAALYVDVGANHPTTISNTFLLYRRGWRGIVIEPNLELVRLFSTFRPRDIALPIACAEAPNVTAFTISKTPVLSSLDANHVGEAWKQLFVPVLPLDTVIRDIAPAWIPVLSVDVEGCAGAVLRGGSRTLERTYLACVEASEGTEEEREVQDALKNAGFSIVQRIGCNVLALNDRREQFEQFRCRPPNHRRVRPSVAGSRQPTW